MAGERRIKQFLEEQGFKILVHQRHQPCPRCNKRYYCDSCKLCEECGYSGYEQDSDLTN